MHVSQNNSRTRISKLSSKDQIAFIFFTHCLIPNFLNNYTFELFDLQWVKLISYIEELYIYVQVAKSELGGEFVEYSGFKQKGIFDCAFVKHMSSDLNS